MKEINFDSIIERIKVKIGAKNNMQVASAIGMSERQFYNSKKANAVPLGYIVEWAVANRVSMDWVLYGTASEIADNEDAPDGFIKVPYYPDIHIAAGAGCVNGDCASQNIRYIAIEATTAPMIANKSKLYAVKVVGDSMAENIKDGAIIICDPSLATFFDGQVFVVSVYGEVKVKRLFRGKTEDTVILKSDNHYYGEEEAPITAVQILARVVRFYNGANI